MHALRTLDLLWFSGHTAVDRHCGKKATITRREASAAVLLPHKTSIRTTAYDFSSKLFESGRAFAELGGVPHFA
jgi:hypothetical protein